MAFAFLGLLVEKARAKNERSEEMKKEVKTDKAPKAIGP